MFSHGFVCRILGCYHESSHFLWCAPLGSEPVGVYSPRLRSIGFPQRLVPRPHLPRKPPLLLGRPLGLCANPKHGSCVGRGVRNHLRPHKWIGCQCPRNQMVFNLNSVHKVRGPDFRICDRMAVKRSDGRVWMEEIRIHHVCHYPFRCCLSSTLPLVFHLNVTQPPRSHPPSTVVFSERWTFLGRTSRGAPTRRTRGAFWRTTGTWRGWTSWQLCSQSCTRGSSAHPQPQSPISHM